MDKELKQELIQRAQQFLNENPQDPMHGVEHHRRVWALVVRLVEEEELEGQVDMDLLEVIVWWHDVSVPGLTIPEGSRIVNATAVYLRDLMPEEFKEKTFDSISNHEFGSTPNFIEGKLLQDADKLEILSETRVNEAVAGIRSGKLDARKMLATLDSVRKNWLPQMLDRYHFSFSKKHHQDHLESFSYLLDRTEKEIRAEFLKEDIH